VCGIACGGEIKRTRSVSLLPTLTFSFHLLDSLSLSLSLFLFVNIVLVVAASLFPSRSRPSSGKHATSFSLLLASASSSSLSLSLDDNVESTPVLSRWFRPLLSALSCCSPRRSSRRDSIIIADSLISINCRAREFLMDFARLKPLLKN